ncbi:MAG: FGGY family carbohydrate kinase [Planctomycetota bacterium]|nr:FGGY family carbohydrate kinase [Planctomycetota bacterium]
MSKGDCILAIDAGTSSLKARVFDADLNSVAETHQPYEYTTSAGMAVQMDVEKIWQALLEACRQFKPWLDKIGVVVPSVLCPGLTAMDEAGNALYPAIIHIDRRSTRQAKEALKRIGKETFLRITGNLPYPGGISLTGMLWLKENEPDIFCKAHVFGHINTYLARRLTGRWGIDPTNASFTGLYETVSGNSWSREIASGLELPLEKMPPVLRPEQVVGHITAEASALTRVPEGVPVLMGANDTSSAAFGAGVTETGQMLNIVGSSEIFVICTDKPVPNESYYVRQHVKPGRWLIMVITTAGFSLEWFRKQFCREMEADEFYKEYLPTVLREKDTGGVQFRPYLIGDRNSMAQKQASFAGLTLATTREQCILSIVTGGMTPMKKAISKCRRSVKLSGTISLTGGGVNETTISLKQAMFPGFKFERIEASSLLGAAKLGRQHLQGERTS